MSPNDLPGWRLTAGSQARRHLSRARGPRRRRRGGKCARLCEGCDAVLIEHLRRHLAQVPDNAGRFEHPEHVVGDVDFPPEKAVARCRRVMMVVVVPSLAERDHREREAVAAVVAGLVAAPAEDVRKRIDRKGAVGKDHGRNEKAPYEHLRTARVQARRMALELGAQPKQREAEQGRNQHVEAIEKHQLRKFREIADDAQFGAEVRLRRDPSDVAPDETMLTRRMNIVGLVGALMMQSMMRRPPKSPALDRRRAHHGEYELAGARGLERAMRKI